MKAHKKSEGFTLVEVLVSLVVATIGITGVMGLSSWLIRAGAWVDHTRQATLMAVGAFEEIQGTDYDSIADGSDLVSGYARTWTVTTSGNTKTIDVQVDWDGIEGGRRRVTFRSLVADPAVAGINFLGSSGSGTPIVTSGGSGDGSDGGTDTGGTDTGGSGNGNGNNNGNGNGNSNGNGNGNGNGKK